MLRWALTFFILAIVAAVFGFGGLAGTFAWGAKVLFIAFVIVTLLFFLMGRRPPA